MGHSRFRDSHVYSRMMFRTYIRHNSQYCIEYQYAVWLLSMQYHIFIYSILPLIFKFIYEIFFLVAHI